MIKNVGPPGCGKTFTASNIAYYLAAQRWQELQAEYFLGQTMLTEWVRQGAADKIENYKITVESYQYFTKHISTHIPCLVTTLAIREYGTGRMSYKLTPDIYAQARRIPEFCVLLNDETGSVFSCRNSTNLQDDVEDFLRFLRHMTDAVGLNTEQGETGDAIGFRKVQDYVNYLGGQDVVMGAKLLEKLYARMFTRYIKRLSKGKYTPEQAKYVGQKLYYLKRFKNSIGFRRIPHELRANGATVMGNKSENYIFPRIGVCQYSDRAFRNTYKAKDLPIDLETWTELEMEEFDLHGQDKLVRKKTAAAAEPAESASCARANTALFAQKRTVRGKQVRNCRRSP